MLRSRRKSSSCSLLSYSTITTTWFLTESTLSLNQKIHTQQIYRIKKYRIKKQHYHKLTWRGVDDEVATTTMGGLADGKRDDDGGCATRLGLQARTTTTVQQEDWKAKDEGDRR
ncbi:unnamed protein product [Linum trigynum]